LRAVVLSPSFPWFPLLHCSFAFLLSLCVDKCLLSWDLFLRIFCFLFASGQCVVVEERSVKGSVHLAIGLFLLDLELEWSAECHDVCSLSGPGSCGDNLDREYDWTLWWSDRGLDLIDRVRGPGLGVCVICGVGFKSERLIGPRLSEECVGREWLLLFYEISLLYSSWVVELRL
jgi:hypothetical protein